MSAERFFSLAKRLVAYRGALRMTAEDESDKTSPRHTDAPNGDTQRSRSSATAPATEKKHYRDIHHNPELAVYFEKGVG